MIVNHVLTTGIYYAVEMGVIDHCLEAVVHLVGCLVDIYILVAAASSVPLFGPVGAAFHENSVGIW